MDRAETERVYRALAAEEDDVTRQIAELEERLGAIKMTRAGLIRLVPSLENVDIDALLGDGTPRPKSLREAVLELMKRDPSSEYTTQRLVDSLQEQGWLLDSNDPEATLRAALRRMDRSKEVYRTKLDGRTYAYWLGQPPEGLEDLHEPDPGPEDDEPITLD